MLRPVESRPSVMFVLRQLQALGACVLLLSSVACAPGADTVDSTETAPTESPQPEEAVAANDVDCHALHEARMGIQGVGNNLANTTSANFFNTFIGDVAELQADIEVLRPYQDIDPEVFGPIREGLENFERDLIAGSEGRFADITGGYRMASINSLLADLGC